MQGKDIILRRKQCYLTVICSIFRPLIISKIYK